MAARKARNTTRQGANFELQIMEHLREHGYDVLRSSGSRGAVDVVAVGDPHTLWIQAKITNPVISPAEREAVRRIAGRISTDALPLVAYRLSGQVCFRLLTGPGPRAFAAWAPYLHATAACACGHEHADHARGTGCWHREMVGEREARVCGCAKFTFPSQARKAEKNERERLARAEARRMREETP